MFTKPCVLITGGAGFVGSNTAWEFVRQGWRVRVLDNLDPQTGANVANITEFGDELEFLKGDVRDRGLVDRAIQGCDAIVHAAALTSHPDSMRDPEGNANVNVLGTIALLESLRCANYHGKFVYLGTTTQLGQQKSHRASEDHSEFPLDIYSANKMVGEKYALIYAHSHGLRALSLRLGNGYGPRCRVDTSSLGFLHFFIGRALDGGKIPVYLPGDQLRNVTYVGDVARAIYLAVVSDGLEGRAWFACSDEHYSLLEIANQISASIGGVVQGVEWPPERKRMEIGNARISSDGFKERSGWKANVGLEDGLRLTLDWFKYSRAGF
jgi:UDP-glucose 4-epimerase